MQYRPEDFFQILLMKYTHFVREGDKIQLDGFLQSVSGKEEGSVVQL